MPQLIAQVKLSNTWFSAQTNKYLTQTENAIKIFNVKYPNGVAVFIFDCSSAHEAYVENALISHKMNWGPSGQLPTMQDTNNPLTGLVQTMNFPTDSIEIDAKGVLVAGKPKGMEQILKEHGLLSEIAVKSPNGKVFCVCKECNKSQVAHDKARKEAKAREDKIEGSGLEGLADRSETEAEDADLHCSCSCCMQCVLSLQLNFLCGKPLLQLVIEKAGHKCFFLPKFHCEQNPIKMVWGQAKWCEYFPYCKNVFILSDQKLQAFMSLQMEHLPKPRHLFQSALTMLLLPTVNSIIDTVTNTWMHTSVLIYTCFPLYFYQLI